MIGITPAAQAAEYTIKSGDNLWTIAKQHHTTVAKIKELNKMSASKLDVGKKLQVPDTVEKNIVSQPAVSRTFRAVTPAPNGATQYTQPDVTSSVDVSRGAVIRRNIMANSFAYIGRPYHYGGTSPKGFDCSGFVRYIFNASGITLPHNSARQYNQGVKVEKASLITGDLVFFHTGGSKRINHVGIYIGDSKFIHAATRRGISVNNLNEKYYKKCYSGARRIIET